MPMSRTVTLCLLTLTLGVALACGDSGPRDPYAKPEPMAATEPDPAPAPTPEPSTPTPEPEPAPVASADPVAAGKEHYQLYCASCHGATGAGDGPVSAGLDPKPAAHSDGEYMNALSDAHLRKVIAEGGAAAGKSPLMAPWGGTLSDDQITDVIAYIRSLAVPPYQGSPIPTTP